VSLELPDGAIDDDAPLVSSVLVDAPLAPPLSLVELLGALLGDELDELLAPPLEASAGVLDPVLLAAGRFNWTSPPDVPVTVLLGDAPLTGTQLVVLASELEELAGEVAANPPDAELGLLTPPVVDAEVLLAVVSPLRVVDGVTPVPFAPFVVFSPVKR
jgi:hypothetical protein